MKRIFMSVRLLLLVAVLALISNTLYCSEKITVMNPAIANPMVDRVALTERLDSLDGKTVYLVDINWGGPDAAYGVFEEMKIWFNENMPKVNVVVKRKAGSYMADDPALWKEIGEKGNAALIGVSG
ncbi:MAG: hypothetical protein JW927_22955 [Deltaproteobacteria bacterium]|nr:hypothetical protein [Deltaproteobacteria bacterium]